MKGSLLVFILFFSTISFGCATLIDAGKAACDLTLGGSMAGGLCHQIDLLKSDSPKVPDPITGE